MSIVKIYRYKDQAVIPSIARTAEGLLVECAPVVLCQIDQPQLPDLIGQTLTAPVLEQPDSEEDNGPDSVVLEALGLKKWRDFEQNALLYTIHCTESSVEVHITGRGQDGFWKRDDSPMLSLARHNRRHHQQQRRLNRNAVLVCCDCMIQSAG